MKRYHGAHRDSAIEQEVELWRSTRSSAPVEIYSKRKELVNDRYQFVSLGAKGARALRASVGYEPTSRWETHRYRYYARAR
jgi:hypothetical protein